MSAVSIVAHPSASLVEPSAWPLATELCWTSEDPVAVTLTLIPDNEVVYTGEPVMWHFSRTLLDAALRSPGQTIGLGDVQIELLENCLMFRFMGDAGVRHGVLVELEPVRKFMIDSYMIVPAAAERVSVDRALEQLLGCAS